MQDPLRRNRGIPLRKDHLSAVRWAWAARSSGMPPLVEVTWPLHHRTGSILRSLTAQ